MAVTGMSLGGYTSSLIASADDRLQAVIPNVPMVNPESVFDDVVPGQQVVDAGPSGRWGQRGGVVLGVGVPLTAELPAAGGQGSAPDHHRSR